MNEIWLGESGKKIPSNWVEGKVCFERNPKRWLLARGNSRTMQDDRQQMTGSTVVD